MTDYKKIYEQLVANYDFLLGQYHDYPSLAMHHVLDLTYVEKKNAYEQLTDDEKGTVVPLGEEEPPPPPIDKPTV